MNFISNNCTEQVVFVQFANKYEYKSEEELKKFDIPDDEKSNLVDNQEDEWSACMGEDGGVEITQVKSND